MHHALILYDTFLNTSSRNHDSESVFIPPSPFSLFLLTRDLLLLNEFKLSVVGTYTLQILKTLDTHYNYIHFLFFIWKFAFNKISRRIYESNSFVRHTSHETLISPHVHFFSSSMKPEN
jgi:hypothetical protein